MGKENKKKIQAIREQLKLDLKPSRYEHTEGVAYTACALAMRYHIDQNRAMIAGLLHDCAKYLDKDQSLELLQYTDLKATEYEIASPQLLHAKCGMILAQEKFKIKDDKILHAILVHTTGAPAMGPLDKIIYIADYIEPNRSEAPNLDEIRALAFINLDQCLLKILENSMNYLKETGKVIDPRTQMTYEYYMEQAKHND